MRRRIATIAFCLLAGGAASSARFFASVPPPPTDRREAVALATKPVKGILDRRNFIGELCLWYIFYLKCKYKL